MSAKRTGSALLLALAASISPVGAVSAFDLHAELGTSPSRSEPTLAEAAPAATYDSIAAAIAGEVEADDAALAAAAPAPEPDTTGALPRDEVALRPAIGSEARSWHRGTTALAPPYEDRDGRVIVSAAASVRLVGIEGPRGDDICLDGSGRPWACGIQARAALRNLIRNQTVVCRDVEDSEDGSASPSCRVGDVDIARRLVSLGLARPEPSRENAFRAELDGAKREGRGLWNGGWAIRATPEP